MSVECAILAIGSELLEGSVVDTNSNYLSSKLSRSGFKVKTVRQVEDSYADIEEALNTLIKIYPLIVTTGGLGPTFDDLTAEIVATVSGRELVRSDIAYEHMMNRLNISQVDITDGHIKQVLLPTNCDLFNNDYGTALGFGVEINGSYIVSLPGVPFEMKYIYEKYLSDFLIDRFKPSNIYFKDIIFVSLSESILDEDIKELNVHEPIQIIINAGKAQVRIKFRGIDQYRESIDKYIDILAKKRYKNFLGYDDETLATYLIRLCRDNGKKIAFAESCTGGMLSEQVTAIAGSSDIFIGSIISYSNRVKVSQLNISEDIIDQFGAVSSEVAVAMAKGVKQLMNVDFAVAITGIAGPTGATDTKPIGLVYISIVSDNSVIVREERLKGDRESIRLRATNIALFLLIDAIKNDINLKK